MIAGLMNAASTFKAHPILAAILLLILIALVVRGFSGVNATKALDGLLRLVGSVLVAPFWFMKAVVRQLVRYRADALEEASSKTYLLWKSMTLSYVLVFVAASTLIAGGLTAALFGAYPSAQLAHRKELKAVEASIDSATRADSVSLASLNSLSAVEAEKQRIARISLMEEQIAKLGNESQSLLDSIRARSTSTNTIVREVYTPYSDPGNRIPTDSSRLARMVAGLDSFAVNHSADSIPQNEIMDFRRYILIPREQQEVSAQLALLQQAENGEAQKQYLTQRLQSYSQQAQENGRALREIDYLAGLKSSIWILLSTYVTLLAVVWFAGMAIESVALVLGISRDLAVLREHAEHAVK